MDRRNHMLASPAGHHKSQTPPQPPLPLPLSHFHPNLDHTSSHLPPAPAPQQSQQFGSNPTHAQTQTHKQQAFLHLPPPPPPPPPPSYSSIAPSSPMRDHHHHHNRHNHYSSPSPQPTTTTTTTTTTATSDRLPPLNNHNHNHNNHHRSSSSSSSNDASHSRTLPSLSSITAYLPFPHSATLIPPRWSAYQNNNNNNNTNNPSELSTKTMSFSRPSHHSPASSNTPAASPMDVNRAGSVMSATSEKPPNGTPTLGSLTLDDPDVRLAAEALGDLRADVAPAPDATTTVPPLNSPKSFEYRSNSRTPSRPRSPKPEPLLSLLTTAHPLVASTLDSANSVYGGAKNFSPRFKSGAEYVEGYLAPLANTVNSVGRVTGVEGGVRWFLGNRRRVARPTSDQDDAGGASSKRRKMDRSEDPRDSPDQSAYDELSFALPLPRTMRRLSASTIETLPAYDDQRSPAYTEVAAPAHARDNRSHPWQTRLIMSTSGLSVAMSAESLRSLRYCLRWLRWANDHLTHVVQLLKHALEEYEKADQKDSNEDDEFADDEQDEKAPAPSRTEIAARIMSLKTDVLKTLQDAINTVSKYAGGALPENAKDLVHRHLTSLPLRFRVAVMCAAKDEEAAKRGDSALEEGAQRVLVLAKEGLDMVAQVSGVLDGTIVSAEQWCERMGKKTGEEKDVDVDVDVKEADGDVEME